MALNSYADFAKQLLDAGFSMGGGNADGIFAVVNHDWQTTLPGSPIVWHTGDRETDPWEWRVRVLNERDDIAYAKCFFKKSGFITQEFYPYFLALRRATRSFDDDFADGRLSQQSRRVYDVLREHHALPSHELKTHGGFGRDEKSRFDAALTELQMRMYITISGSGRRVSTKGEEYGWDAMLLCTTEHFWEHTDVFARAANLSEAVAYAAIRDRVLQLNPAADEKKIRKFAYGK